MHKPVGNTGRLWIAINITVRINQNSGWLVSIELYTVEAASVLGAASFIKVDIAVGFVCMKVECVEPAEIVYSYSIKFCDLAAVSGKIMAFWDITSCNACK